MFLDYIRYFMINIYTHILLSIKRLRGSFVLVFGNKQEHASKAMFRLILHFARKA